MTPGPRAVLTLAMAAAVVSCNSPPQNIAFAADAAGGDSPASDGAQPADGSMSRSDAGNPPPVGTEDASDDAPDADDASWPADPQMPEGGLPSSPGQVACGSSSCSVPSEVCCTPTTGGADADNGGSCQSATNCVGLTEACDESADCPGGQTCCLVTWGWGGVESRCMPPTQCEFSLCRLTSQCEHVGPCVGQMCAGMFVETCGALPPSDCQ